MAKTIAIGGAAVYGVGAIVQLGLQIQKALAGTGRPVFLSDVGNALVWPLSLLNVTLIPPGGPVLVPSAMSNGPALPPSQSNTIAGTRKMIPRPLMQAPHQASSVGGGSVTPIRARAFT